jgi:hypothetical protein
LGRTIRTEAVGPFKVIGVRGNPLLSRSVTSFRAFSETGFESRAGGAIMFMENGLEAPDETNVISSILFSIIDCFANSEKVPSPLAGEG